MFSEFARRGCADAEYSRVYDRLSDTENAVRAALPAADLAAKVSVIARSNISKSK
ncbi:MAG: hypothetical protein WAV38_37645 [Xanthobacteraceae bacterium]